MSRADDRRVLKRLMESPAKRTFLIDMSVGTPADRQATIIRWRDAMTMYNTKLLMKHKDGWKCKLCGETMAKGLKRYSDAARDRVRVHFKLVHKINKDGRGW